VPASTSPDNFPFEVVGDQPGISLHGGLSGTEDILAEVVQDKFVTTDTTLSDLTARVTALETGTGGAGWIPIDFGSDSGASFSIDLTAGGKFPSPPLWNMVRFHMRVDLDAVGTVSCRVNGDADSVYTAGSSVVDAENNFDAVNWYFPGSSSWRIAHLSTISTGNLILTLFRTDANPGLISFQCESARMSSTDGSVHRRTHAWGALTSAKTLSSMQFFAVDGAMSFVNAVWWAEGLRMEHPTP
jgi:hypothetical protein